MKKITYSLIILVALTFAYSSCKDASLDPLQTDKIGKGKLLVLRGKQLDNIYNQGIPGAELFPKLAVGTETFSFDAEYLSDNPNGLQSLDIFVKKFNVSGKPDRVLLRNVPFSAFKKDATYPNPWVTVTFTLPEIFTKLGLSTIFPLDTTTIKTILKNYKFGIGIETDLNLADGSKALASNVVAAGLFSSNQFYPAQKLNYAMTDYCSYIAASWAGAWVGTEVGACCSGDDAMTFTQDGVNPNKFTFTNFWGDGPAATAYIVFAPSTKPSDQKVSFPDQTTGEGFKIVNSKGTYDQCKQQFTINTTYLYSGSSYTWLYVFNRP